MTSRERMLALVFGTLLLAGGGFAAYQVVGKPILDKKKRLATLEEEALAVEDRLTDVRLKNKRLTELYQRGLPGDVEFAKREYDSLLYKMLEEAGAPRGFIVKDESAKVSSAAALPMLNPEVKADKTPAYTKVAFRIEMKRADLEAVTEFLKRYYRLNLLHQITFLEIKREGSADLTKDDRPAREREDLTVNIVTEAIIINGTPARRTLLPIPPSNGAALGGAGLWAMTQTPAVGRSIVPHQFEPALAFKPTRDYFLMAAKDPFHGALPVPKPPVVKKDEVVVVPPKPDYSEHIKYSTLFRTTDGDEQSVEILVRDQINNEDYELTLTQAGERVKAVVRKYYFIGGVKKKPVRSDTLDIDNSSMSTKHSFKVHGLDGNALILSEKAVPKAAEPAKDGRPARGPRPADPMAAVVGGMAAVPQAVERFYRWENGQKLNEIVELTGKEAEKAVQRAQAGLFDRAATDPAADPMAASGK